MNNGNQESEYPSFRIPVFFKLILTRLNKHEESLLCHKEKSSIFIRQTGYFTKFWKLLVILLNSDIHFIYDAFNRYTCIGIIGKYIGECSCKLAVINCQF